MMALARLTIIMILLIIWLLELYITRVINPVFKTDIESIHENVKSGMFLEKEMYQYLDECKCWRNVTVIPSHHQMKNIDKQLTNLSSDSCSNKSFERGIHQKIVAYTYFEGSSFDKNSRNYLNGIEDNLQKIKILYGDIWIMRLYHDIPEDSESLGKVCEIACKNSMIELCNVNQNSNIYIKISTITSKTPQEGEPIHKIYPLIWRFLPILDPNVDILLSRDLDSTITSREVEAVKQFLNSSKDFHIIRDHPNHIQPIMGGLWGIKLADPEMRKTYQTLFKEALEDIKISLAPRTERNHDQELLLKHFWPIVRNQAFMHDSYSCTKYWNSQPFPTQRIKNEAGNFVGAVLSKHQKVPKPCPIHCRPYNHKDWSAC